MGRKPKTQMDYGDGTIFYSNSQKKWMPPKVLQNLLGHTDISVTLNTYSDVFESFRTENVAKADDYLTGLGMSVS